MMIKKHKQEESSEFKTIKLHDDHDIIAVIEALRFNRELKFNLILPSNPVIFYSPFNYKLLKDIKIALKKELVLITSNEIIIELAKEYDLLTSPIIIENFDKFKSKLDLNSDDATKEFSKSDKIKDKPKKKSKSPKKISRPPLEENLDSNASASLLSKINFKMVIYGLILLFILSSVIFVTLFIQRTAVINIQTDLVNLSLDTELEVELSQINTEVDLINKVAPLQIIRFEAPADEYQVPANGSRVGGRAIGLVKVFNCHTQNDLVIDSNTVFRKDSKDFKIFDKSLKIIIQPSADTENCQSTAGGNNNSSFKIEAVGYGESYNLSRGSYEIVGFDPDDYNVLGEEPTSGGQPILTCVTSEDLIKAELAFEQQRQDEQNMQELRARIVNKGLIPLEGTFKIVEGELIKPDLCPSRSDQVLSQTVVYYMAGVDIGDIQSILEPALIEDNPTLEIIDYGLDKTLSAEFNSDNSLATLVMPTNWRATLTLNVNAKAGIKLDREQILEEALGQPANQVAFDLRKLDGVTGVDINLFPSWAIWLRNLPNSKSDIELKIND